MKVSELMTRDVASCKMNHSVDCSARIMWECDCGCVPIVDDEDRVVGMLTDRDICMAALSQGRPLDDIKVRSAATNDVVCAREDASIEEAEALMQKHQIRRIPVIDRNGVLQGILSMNDIARHFQGSRTRTQGLSGDFIAQTLAAICAPHGAQKGA